MTEERVDRTSSAEQIRDVVLSDHAALRARLRMLATAVDHASRTGERRPLRVAFRGVLDQLENHLRLEDELLVPTLRSVPDVGATLAARVGDEHRTQRAMIADLRGRLDEPEALQTLLAEAAAFIALLEADMVHEEETVLRPSLLTDDWIHIAFGG